MADATVVRGVTEDAAGLEVDDNATGVDREVDVQRWDREQVICGVHHEWQPVQWCGRRIRQTAQQYRVSMMTPGSSVGTAIRSSGFIGGS